MSTPFPPLALGVMNFGKRTPEPDALSIVSVALERGITLFDTANAYTDGASERILGKALKKHRDRVQIATKVGFGRISGKPEGLSRGRMLAAIDESLSRLGTDYVDVYYLHVPDRSTPIEESLDAMATLLESKKVRSWGVSNYASWEILEMMHLADARSMPRPAISQQMYNMLIRQLEIEYFRFAAKHSLHTTVYNPLAGGLLSGKHASTGEPGEPPKGSRFAQNSLYQRRYWSDAMFSRVAQLQDVANDAGLSLLELAYSWTKGRAGVDSILIGPGTVGHLTEALDALGKSVSAETSLRIDALHKAWEGTDASYAR